MTPVAFSFDPVAHAYYIGDERVPSITQMIEQVGLIDTTWMTDEGRDRGTAIHDLTRDLDLGVLNLDAVQWQYKPWVLAYREAVHLMKPKFHAIEEADVHPHYRFGGRPDRVATIFGRRTILEIKSGAASPSHQIQTALQAILVAWRGGIPAPAYARVALYLKQSGRFVFEFHDNQSDFDRAYTIIKETCRGKC